jgi:hypothetical protein
MQTTAGWVQDLRATWMPVVNAERKDRARSAILDDDDRTRDRNILNAVCWPIGIMNLLCHLAGKTLTQKANPSAFDFWLVPIDDLSGQKNDDRASIVEAVKD